MALELVPLRPEALKARVILVATLWKRLMKATMPLVAVTLRVPCKVPLPARRAAVTTVPAEMPLAALRRLPN